jgi:hypothetical protein
VVTAAVADDEEDGAAEQGCNRLDTPGPGEESSHRRRTPFSERLADVSHERDGQPCGEQVGDRLGNEGDVALAPEPRRPQEPRRDHRDNHHIQLGDDHAGGIPGAASQHRRAGGRLSGVSGVGPRVSHAPPPTRNGHPRISKPD